MGAIQEADLMAHVMDQRVRISQLEAKLERATVALKVFADDKSWRLNGSCDADGFLFEGQDIALKALKELADETTG